MGPLPPELDRQTDRRTRLKTLPSRTLRMRAVKIPINMEQWKFMPSY